MQVNIVPDKKYEYEFKFSLCNFPCMNSWSVDGFPEAKLHRGINDGSNFKQCRAEDTQYSFIYKTDVSPSQLHLCANSIVKNWIKGNLSDIHVNLSENGKPLGYYSYYRCYKKLRVSLLPPKYEECLLQPKYEE